MRRYRSLIRVINLTLNEISDIITTKQKRCNVRSGSLSVHFFQGSRSVLLRTGSMCTAKRNKPRDHGLGPQCPFLRKCFCCKQMEDKLD